MIRILYIYRHPDMGHSIRRVFAPIEKEMRMYCEVDSISLPVPNYSLRGLLLNIRAARASAKKNKYDIVHITGTEHYLIPFLKEQKVVVTVHDLESLLVKGNRIRSLVKNWLFINSLKDADGITFISQKTCDECNQVVCIDENKQIVIGNPVDTNLHYVHKEFNYERPVILHIGTTRNKNLHNTILALNGVGCHLRIIGKLSEQDKEELAQNKISYSNVFDLSDEGIRQEFINCDIVNFPSLYEGFGMPIIEGQAVGRVVVTSNISPMKEVSGGGAMLVDPENVDCIRDAYLRILADSHLRNSLIKKGSENVKCYAVKNITKVYYYFYTSISL